MLVEPSADFETARPRAFRVRDFVAWMVGLAAFIAAVEPGLFLSVGAAICVFGIAIMAPRYRFTTTDYFAILVFVVWWGSQAWSVSPESTGYATSAQFYALLVFLAIRMTGVTRRALVIITLGFVAGCAVVATRQIANGNGTSFNEAFITAAPRAGLEGVNINYSAYTLCTGLAAIVLLWHFSSSKLASKPVLLLVTALLLGGLIRTGTRGAIASVLLLGLWLALNAIVRRPPLRLLLVGSAATTVVVATGILDSALRSSVTASAREVGDLNGRLTVWPIARESFLNHPIIGTGAGTFRSMNFEQIGAHNAALEVASGVGVVGLLLYFGTVISASSRTPDRRTKLVVGSFVAASLPILLSGFWDQSIVFWLALALWSSAGRVNWKDRKAGGGPDRSAQGSLEKGSAV